MAVAQARHVPKISSVWRTSTNPWVSATSVGPLLDLGSFDLFGPAAVATDEVVMVLGGLASSVEGLAVVGAQHVDLAALGQGSQLVVDGREPHVLAPGLEVAEQLLGRTEPV